MKYFCIVNLGGIELSSNLREYIDRIESPNLLSIFLNYSRKKPMELLIALDNKEEAKGQMFWDDGESNGKHTHTYYSPCERFY